MSYPLNPEDNEVILYIKESTLKKIYNMLDEIIAPSTVYRPDQLEMANEVIRECGNLAQCIMSLLPSLSEFRTVE